MLPPAERCFDEPIVSSAIRSAMMTMLRNDYDKFFHTIRLLFEADIPGALAEYLIALDIALKARLSEEDDLSLAAYFFKFWF